MESIIFLIGFFFSLVLFFYLGSRVANYQKAPIDPKKSFGHQLLEGSIFSLMGLIVAFTFATSNQKMDMRRILIIDEANAIGTAYLRLDMLSDQQQPVLRNYFRQYLSARLEIYKAFPNFTKIYEGIHQSTELQKKIWTTSVIDCKKNNDKSACIILLPALNEMFDIANKRIEIANLHPPLIVFYLLISIALLSAFLSGYDIKYRERKRSMIFILSYIFVIAITIYIIIDMEYPRLGFIKINSFDKTLQNVSAMLN